VSERTLIGLACCMQLSCTLVPCRLITVVASVHAPWAVTLNPRPVLLHVERGRGGGERGPLDLSTQAPASSAAGTMCAELAPGGSKRAVALRVRVCRLVPRPETALRAEPAKLSSVRCAFNSVLDPLPKLALEYLDKRVTTRPPDA
jgi:hypothetical protein